MTLSRISVETLWCDSTLSTTTITRKGGKMVSTLSTREAMPMSRSDLPLAQHHVEQPAEGERRVGLGMAALGAQQHGLAGPHLVEAHLVHRDRRLGGRAERVLQEDDLVFGVDAR